MISQNLQNIQTTLLRDIRFTRIVENMEPSTINGKHVKNSLVSYINENKINSITSIVNSLNYINTSSSFDNSILKASEEITERLNNESFLTKLVYVAENIDNSKQSEFAKAALSKLDKLSSVRLDEAFEMIRNGYLNQFCSTYPLVNLLINEAKIKSTNCNESSSSYQTYNPNTIKTNKNTFVKIRGKVYAFNDKNVVESSCPSEQFNYLSSILNEVKYNKYSNSFVFEHDAIGVVNATATSLELNEHSYNLENVATKCKQIFESKYYNNPRLEKLSKQLIDGCVLLAEHLNEVKTLDNVCVVENTQTGDVFAMFKLPENVYVATVESVRYPQILEAFTNPSDAVEYLKKRTGYDASEFLAENIAEYVFSENKKTTFVSEQLNIVNTIQSKVNEIENLLVEANSNNNYEQAAELKKILEDANALLIEQKSILANASR